MPRSAADPPPAAGADTGLERRLERISDLMRRLLRTVRVPDARIDMTPTQLVVFFHLYEHPSLRIGALARKMGTAQNTVSEVVSRLQRAGFVRKQRDPADQRAVMVALTESGRSAFEVRRELMRRQHKLMLEALSAEDQARFMEAFERIVSIIERARDANSQSKADTRRRR
jgi:DNA-binding MarR family transcriptional regulator